MTIGGNAKLRSTLRPAAAFVVTAGVCALVIVLCCLVAQAAMAHMIASRGAARASFLSALGERRWSDVLATPRADDQANWREMCQRYPSDAIGRLAEWSLEPWAWFGAKLWVHLLVVVALIHALAILLAVLPLWWAVQRGGVPRRAGFQLAAIQGACSLRVLPSLVLASVCVAGVASGWAYLTLVDDRRPEPTPATLAVCGLLFLIADALLLCAALPRALAAHPAIGATMCPRCGYQSIGTVVRCSECGRSKCGPLRFPWAPVLDRLPGPAQTAAMLVGVLALMIGVVAASPVLCAEARRRVLAAPGPAHIEEYYVNLMPELDGAPIVVRGSAGVFALVLHDDLQAAWWADPGGVFFAKPHWFVAREHRDAVLSDRGYRELPLPDGESARIILRDCRPDVVVFPWPVASARFAEGAVAARMRALIPNDLRSLPSPTPP